MAKRIDWDKARRNKNARKPDYRDAFLDGRTPVSFTLAVPGPRKSPATRTTKFTYTQPNTAGRIRAHLKAAGAKGNKLTALTNDVLRGKKQLAIVIYELQFVSLIDQGFDPMPPEISGDTAILRLLRFSDTDEVEEATFTFKKPPRSDRI